MELDVTIGGESLSINIDNPFHLDLKSITDKIEEFLRPRGLHVNGLDIEGLLPRMVRGIAGCEDGCPADAKSLVSQGFNDFDISYIEGGILSVKADIEGGKTLELKMFPEF
ncbi:hypothetical protein BMS3Abin07_01253 [bacterium BMS3Abin07]|nr:hypothetical protein BMS3Abin07_01253 [bacterium BMS3Abin07]GBE33220.1 hypothetical protein BMS3Bbin05_02159 [bacterium BMS3Bbin05]HDO22766.1 hypothetical protein [Nitrospirota bacterium]HDZ87513.1 hypothetical protein [Nitrospirota bacterium]